MKKKYLYIYIVLGFLLVALVAETGASGLHHDSHHNDIGANSDSDCCNSSLNETDHCHDPNVHSKIVVLSNNIRPSCQLNFAKVYVSGFQSIFINNRPSNIHPKNLPIYLPNELSFKSTIILLI